LIPIALTVAGSDPGGGAGLQADLKTFHRFGVYGTSAVTLITVQNPTGITRVELLSADLVAAQIEAILSDFAPKAIKSGALGSESIIRSVASCSFRVPLVVDPVLVSSSGATLLPLQAIKALRDLLFPRATLITPNLAEAAQLTGREVSSPQQMRDAARQIGDSGAESVLVKGGHLEGDDSLDILLSESVFTEFHSPRIETRHTHGTGCTYSAAITALLARGVPLVEAISEAKAFISEAIRTAPGIGTGAGPLNFWANPL